MNEITLQLSGLQHYLFCKRQWALIHIEMQWKENYYTADGQVFHQKAHNEALTEKRGDLIITRGMDIFSKKHCISGKCDVLEFNRNPKGIKILDWEGLWLPFPVEYKRGEPKKGNFDVAQLCAQAICLEEMLCCEINEGALFYGEPKRRYPVEFNDDLRNVVISSLKEMKELFLRGYTPKVKPTKSCSACSIKDLCLPKLLKKQENVEQYIHENLEEMI